MHSRELNPYWKEGGTGLPQANKEQIRSVDSKLPRPGDGGISWLKKAYQRCEEKAKEEGRSLEDVAAERWGVGEQFIACIFIPLKIAFL